MLWGALAWALLGAAFVIFGIYTLFSKKAVRYWANISKKIEVTDIKGYNRAAGKLWIFFGLILCLLGLPFLKGQNSPWIIISIIGTLFDAIIVMAGLINIESKYEKRK